MSKQFQNLRETRKAGRIIKSEIDLGDGPQTFHFRTLRGTELDKFQKDAEKADSSERLGKMLEMTVVDEEGNPLATSAEWQELDAGVLIILSNAANESLGLTAKGREAAKKE